MTQNNRGTNLSPLWYKNVKDYFMFYFYQETKLARTKVVKDQNGSSLLILIVDP